MTGGRKDRRATRRRDPRASRSAGAAWRPSAPGGAPPGSAREGRRERAAGGARSTEPGHWATTSSPGAPSRARDESDPESEESLLDRQPAPAQNPVDAIGRERTLKRLWEAVGRLAPQQQAAVILQVQEELPTREIAAVLKCSEATVRVHLHRAVSTLRKTLKTTETD